MDVIQRNDTVPFTTVDGSQIRELLAYRNSSIRHQSLAEATLMPGRSTQEHYHPIAEEIYYILTGTGLMRLEGEERRVGPGDAIAIPPGQKHKIFNEDAAIPLVFLCCCAPCYEHADVVFTEPAPTDGPSLCSAPTT